MRRSAVAIPIFLAALVAGCSADPKSPTEPTGGGDPPDPTATLTRVQREIFTPKCAFSGCHGTPGPQQGMDLTDGHAFANIVGVTAKESTKKRIAPKDPEGSYMVNKIRGDVGISGGRMPLDSVPLTDAQIKLVVDWVRNGAKND